MNRREAVRRMAAGILGLALGEESRCAETQRCRMGLVIYSVAHQQRAWKRGVPSRDLSDPLEFLEYCRRLGAGGIQLPLGIRDESSAKTLRAKAEDHGLFVEANVSPPAGESDKDRFEAEIRTAAAAGAQAARTVLMPGRRYEFFDSLDKFRESDERGRRSLEMAAPIVERHRVRLAVENHKTHLAADQATLLRRIGSPFVGACVDTGNNLALLEDPLTVVETLAPLAFSVHLKDQAVQEYAEGLLLADVPLGQGALDVKRMVSILRAAQPQVRFSLELITREPLKVPCLTDKYWVTFPAVPASALARALRWVREHAAPALPQVDPLPLAEQLALEQRQIRQSLDFATAELGL